MKISFATGYTEPDYCKNKTYDGFRKYAGIVCQGGGAKCSWQAGVLSKLHQDNINIRTYFGTSAGALNAALCFVEKWDILSNLWTNKEILNVFKPKFYLPFRLNYQLLYNMIDSYITDEHVNAEAKSKNIYIRVSNIKSGLSELKMFDHKRKDGKLSDCLKATSALFPFFPKYKMNTIDYVDGGLFSNCPVEYVNDIGDIESIIISPTRPVRNMNINSSVSILVRMVDMMLYTQLILSLNSLIHKLTEYNCQPERSLIGLYRTVYLISPSEELNNDTIKITEKGSRCDYQLGMKDAEDFINNPSSYDIEKYRFSFGV